ncbi:MAG: reverse transcriptase domain-containing protein [Isosphaeraceae bacterium]|nr:reverse transcriptase domain-containing protein [Isosphaeraceae bacterium]
MRIGQGRRFEIRDPKPRAIFAPCFRERVLHHALMNRIGPVLDRALINDTYACRARKGTLAATCRVQEHVRRFAWYAKLDVRAYFASIRHSILLERLRRRIKGDDVLALVARIIAAHGEGSGQGLPIGALTSQCLANYYLDPLDRFLLNDGATRGYVRYMDDFVFWTETRQDVMRLVRDATEYLERVLALTAKAPVQIGRSARGITVCGYRVLSDSIHLGRRRKRRYLESRRCGEAAYQAGVLSAEQLQRAHDAGLAITAHAETRAWFRARASDRTGADWRDEV